MERKRVGEESVEFAASGTLHSKALDANEAILAQGVDLVGCWPDPASGTEVFSVRNPRPQDPDILREFVGSAFEIVPYRGSPIEPTGA